MTKTGRNTPCPCGSNRKYKHCCLQRVREERMTAIEEQRRSIAGNVSRAQQFARDTDLSDILTMRRELPSIEGDE